jgi:hypothetical protein
MNQLYARVREQMAKAQFNWVGLVVHPFIWRGPYVFSEAHVSATDVASAGGAPVMAGAQLTGMLVKPGGYCTSYPALLPAVAVGAPVTFMTLVDGSQNLIAYIDEAVGLPFTPNGLDWLVQPDWLPRRGWFRG